MKKTPLGKKEYNKHRRNNRYVSSKLRRQFTMKTIVKLVVDDNLLRILCSSRGRQFVLKNKSCCKIYSRRQFHKRKKNLL